MDKLTHFNISYNYFKGIEDFGYESDNPWAELKYLYMHDSFDCPGYSSATIQSDLDPSATTYSGDADRWLLDRRKDGTAAT